MGQRSVLVVEDEELFRQTVVDGLNEWFEGVDAIGVCDGIEALEVLSRRPIQVLVTDLQMPRMDGITLLREVLNRGLKPSVVVMTAHGTPELERWTTSQLAFALFEKPVELTDLLTAVDRLLCPADTGHLEGITLPGLCQLLQIEQKTCDVRVRSGHRAGRLLFRNGLLHDAVHEDAVGNAAATDILTWSSPKVEIAGRIPPGGSQRVTEDLTFLLMEAVRVLDERAGKKSDMAPRATHEMAASNSRPPPPIRIPSLRETGTRSPGDSGMMAAMRSVSPPSPLPASAAPGGPPVAPAVLGPEAEMVLQNLLNLYGYLDAAIVEVATGRVLAKTSPSSPTLEMTCVGHAEVFRAERDAIRSLRLGETIEETLLTHGTEYHVLRPVRSHPEWLLCLVLKRTGTNIALARIALADAERIVSNAVVNAAPLITLSGERGILAGLLRIIRPPMSTPPSEGLLRQAR